MTKDISIKMVFPPVAQSVFPRLAHAERPQLTTAAKKEHFQQQKKHFFIFLPQIFFLQIFCLNASNNCKSAAINSKCCKTRVFGRKSHFQKSDLGAGGGRRRPARDSRKIAVTPLVHTILCHLYNNISEQKSTQSGSAKCWPIYACLVKSISII